MINLLEQTFWNHHLIGSILFSYWNLVLSKLSISLLLLSFWQPKQYTYFHIAPYLCIHLSHHNNLKLELLDLKEWFNTIKFNKSNRKFHHLLDSMVYIELYSLNFHKQRSHSNKHLFQAHQIHLYNHNNHHLLGQTVSHHFHQGMKMIFDYRTVKALN